ncbi:hypothetical protein [Stappia sp.]
MAVPERILFRIFTPPAVDILETRRAVTRGLREIGPEFGKS